MTDNVQAEATLDLKPTLDEEHYPTDETELRIRKFAGDPKVLMAAIREVWMYADCGYWDEADKPREYDKTDPEIVHRYRISTAGWSGNESIMDALQNNMMFWTRFWQEHRKGGHYIFDIPEACLPVRQLNGYLTIKERLAKAEALAEAAENRHVVFMVQGGPVVMASDHEALRVLYEEARTQLEELKPRIQTVLDSCMQLCRLAKIEVDLSKET